MKAQKTQDGLTLRVIAGIDSVILGLDLEEPRRAGCLGFSIQRVDLGPAASPFAPDKQDTRWLPNMLRFPKDTSSGANTSDCSPIQKFRWGDWTARPGHTYLYTATARYGTWDHLTDGPSASVQVTAEDPANPDSAVYFNRGAAASNAYNEKFGDHDPDDLPEPQRQRAYAWLSRGLEEAILAFLSQAKDSTYALHAAVYEFQKPELLQGLKDAIARGVQVSVVYHDRHKPSDPKDDTWSKNEAAVEASGLGLACVRRQADPQDAISHNKFVILLKDDVPQAVWTGSTNWTDGAIYGQLNVGHAVYDGALARTYESYFQLLHDDALARPLKSTLAKLTPVPDAAPAGSCVLPIFSPQSNKKMLQLYASICANARSLLVCAPFQLASEILEVLKQSSPGTLRFILVDKTGSLGNKQQEEAIAGDTGTEVSVATTLSDPLHDFQNRILEDQESYHHAGVHIHAKIIVADPLGPDPIVVTGSANFSRNSTLANDSNSLIIRGNTAVGDIYATEFMRMFEHYYFRGRLAQQDAAGKPLALAEDASWTDRFYVPGNSMALARKLFAGTDGAADPTGSARRPRRW